MDADHPSASTEQSDAAASSEKAPPSSLTMISLFSSSDIGWRNAAKSNPTLNWTGKFSRALCIHKHMDVLKARHYSADTRTRWTLSS
ncbi:hypothetical protein MRX96_009667 [Rhipicephalus microplus]